MQLSFRIWFDLKESEPSLLLVAVQRQMKFNEDKCRVQFELKFSHLSFDVVNMLSKSKFYWKQKKTLQIAPVTTSNHKWLRLVSWLIGRQSAASAIEKNYVLKNVRNKITLQALTHRNFRVIFFAQLDARKNFGYLVVCFAKISSVLIHKYRQRLNKSASFLYKTKQRILRTAGWMYSALWMKTIFESKEQTNSLTYIIQN